MDLVVLEKLVEILPQLKVAVEFRIVAKSTSIVRVSLLKITICLYLDRGRTLVLT